MNPKNDTYTYTQQSPIKSQFIVIHTIKEETESVCIIFKDF